MEKVVVAMSGGVDSSVAALLLKEAGYDVVGLFMKNWEETDSECCAAKDYQDALDAAETLKIPLYTVNFAKDYWDRVFQSFLQDLQKGATPNPDILCNREIKFSCLLKKALSLGASYLATGHYVRKSSNNQLLRGVDSNKDQSYFLYTINESILQKTLFPIGEIEKPQVREIAKKAGLITADKKDSTGICFIGKRQFAPFIAKYLPAAKGVFQTEDGEILGEHKGAWFYTIGQRKGLGIGGPGDAWFVAKKDIHTHTVTLVQGENHPLLFTQEIQATEVSWVNEKPELPYRCTAKIRYRSQDVPCALYPLGSDSLKIIFDKPVRAVTSRQAIVFYQKNICLGGGFIKTH